MQIVGHIEIQKLGAAKQEAQFARTELHYSYESKHGEERNGESLSGVYARGFCVALRKMNRTHYRHSRRKHQRKR